MKFTTRISLSGLIAPSRLNQARGHRGHTLQKSQKAGGFAQPSAGYSGRFGGQRGGRAIPTGSYGAAGSRQSSAAVAPSIVATPIASSVATSIASSAINNIASPSTTSASTPAAAAHDDEYNVSWAGAVLDDGGSTIYTGVYTEFVVPIPKKTHARRNFRRNLDRLLLGRHRRVRAEQRVCGTLASGRRRFDRQFRKTVLRRLVRMVSRQHAPFCAHRHGWGYYRGESDLLVVYRGNRHDGE